MNLRATLPSIFLTSASEPSMKLKLAFAASALLLAGQGFAQSAFKGFYGQVATGYESNSMDSMNGAFTSSRPEYYPQAVSTQQFGGAPIVVGLGYNFSVAPRWLIGIGADYSLLSQKSSTFTSTVDLGRPDVSFNPSGSSVQISNRLNIFIAPSYEISKDQLVYLKAGYSSVSAKLSGPTSLNVSGGGVETTSIPLSSNSSTSTVGGYVVGIGYKQIITGGFYGFAEANYMSYAKPSFSNSSSVDGTSVSSSLSASLNSYQVLLGVGYRF